MSRINKLLTLLSLTALVVTIERFSPTTKILLQPYDFLRFHEVFQMGIIIFIGVVISFLLLKEVSDNFRLVSDRRGLFLGILFIAGTYFYATGNGLHEVASHLFNTFCNVKRIENTACGAMFFNDYYFGNGLYFFGFLLSNLSLIALEVRRLAKKTSRLNIFVTLANSALFTLTMIAYAAFDRVSVGLWFLLVSAAIILPIFLKLRQKILSYPFTLYCVFAYPLAALVSLVVRLTR